MTIVENGFVLVPRSEWGARYSAGKSPMPKQVNTVVIHHTVTSAKGDPCQNMRTVENALNGRGLAPGYSYVIDPSGVILEGAGAMKGAHTEGMNSSAYGISFIGDFTTTTPTLGSILAASRLINVLRLAGKLPADLNDLKILLHRDTKATACPGAHLTNINGKTIADWIRWFAATGA